MTSGSVSGASALLQELLEHPERNVKTLSDVLSDALSLVVRGHDSFPQVQRQHAHGRSVPQTQLHGCRIIQNAPAGRTPPGTAGKMPAATRRFMGGADAEISLYCTTRMR